MSNRFLDSRHTRTYYLHGTSIFGLLVYHFRLTIDVADQPYETVLEESIGFDNPRSIEHLAHLVGLDSNTFYTNMSSLRGKYPNDEYAAELRQSQASSWAFRYFNKSINFVKTKKKFCFLYIFKLHQS